MIYEAINQKRLELSVADLFKNYLIRKTKDKLEKEQVIVIWKEIVDSLDNDIRPFLKHYWHSKKGVITERRLFHELKRFVEDKKQKNDPFILIKELGEESKIYSALNNPDDDRWDAGIKELIEEFNTLGVEQPLPILMIAKKNFSDSDFKDLLEAIINFSFRYNIICNKPPNVLERRYSDIARRIRGEYIKDGETKIENAKQVLALLKEYYPTDEELEKNFLGKTIEKNKISLYLWSKINKRLQEIEKPNPADLSVEHILPKKPDLEWEQYLVGKGYAEDDFDDLIYRIGNQTAMDIKMNTQARNKIFTKKRDENYKDSNMPINEMLKSITDWTEKEISQREKDYVGKVKEIWKTDF